MQPDPSFHLPSIDEFQEFDGKDALKTLGIVLGGVLFTALIAKLLFIYIGG